MTGETPAVHEALAVYAPEKVETGRVPPGYRLSEVGVIPEDWEVKRLENFAPLQRGFDLPNSMLRKGSYPVAYSNGVLKYHDDYRAKSPGVVTGRSGTIGNVNYIEEDYWPHNTALWVTDFKDNYPKFVYYLYSSIGFDRFGTGSGVPTLNRNDIHAFSVGVPSSAEEQRAIATALSDVDALISALDKLISKKRAVKTAAMQQLLTGKQRLPGFSGEWQVKRLGNLGECLRGVSYNGSADLSAYEIDTTVRLLRSSNVQNATVVTTDLQFVISERVSKRQMMQFDDILVCMANGSNTESG